MWLEIIGKIEQRCDVVWFYSKENITLIVREQGRMKNHSYSPRKRDNGGLDQGGSNGRGKKMLSFKYILRSRINNIFWWFDVEVIERGTKDLA